MQRSIQLGQRRVLVDRVQTAALVTITFWSLNVTIVKSVVGQWLPLAYSVDRFVVGTLLFAAWVWWREGSLRFERRDVPLLLAAGAVGIAGNQIGFMYAEQHANATTISLLMATTPAFAVGTAWLLRQERVGYRYWLGLTVAVAGVALVLRGAGAHLALSSLRGDLFAVLMASSWGVYSALIRPLMRRYSASRISALVLVVGTVILIPIGWRQVIDQRYGAVSVGGWAAIVFSLFFSLVITNILWFGAIHRGGAARVTAMLPLQPFLGAIFAVLLLGEHVGLLELAGGVVIVVGIRLGRDGSGLASTATAD